MQSKRFLATTVTLLGLGGWLIAPALAVNSIPQNPLQLSADPQQQQQQTIYQNTDSTTPTAGASATTQMNSVPATQDDIPLRAHLGTLPRGTIIMVKIDQPLASTTSHIGDAVSATVENDVYAADNQVIIPAGSIVEGSVTEVSSAGHVGKPGSIGVQFAQVKTSTGMVYSMPGHIVTSNAQGIIRGDSEQAQVLKTLGSAAGITAASTVGGVAAGALLGSVGGGAIFGLAAGGLAGIGYAVVREGNQVIIPSGARVSIVLDQPVGTN